MLPALGLGGLVEPCLQRLGEDRDRPTDELLDAIVLVEAFALHLGGGALAVPLDAALDGLLLHDALVKLEVLVAHNAILSVSPWGNCPRWVTLYIR